MIQAVLGVVAVWRAASQSLTRSSSSCIATLGWQLARWQLHASMHALLSRGCRVPKVAQRPKGLVVSVVGAVGQEFDTGGRIGPGKVDKSRKTVKLHESVGSGYGANSLFAAVLFPLVPSVQRILPNLLLAIGLLLKTIF